MPADEFTHAWPRERGALIIAHPGHELRIHHWLERARPLTFVLTDGSGHTDISRLRSTATVLERAGARRGSIFGVMSDRQLYHAILTGERDAFTRLVDELASALQREGVSYVVADAVEGTNPGHDVCRLLVNAALMRIDDKGRRLVNMEFPVEGPPAGCSAEDRDHAIMLTLDDAAYERKLEAARQYPEIAEEMKRVLGIHGAEAFRVECLRPVRYALEIGHLFPHPCVYETYGEKQVATGFYSEVLRFGTHVAPLAAHLERYCRAAH